MGVCRIYRFNDARLKRIENAHLESNDESAQRRNEYEKQKRSRTRAIDVGVIWLCATVQSLPPTSCAIRFPHLRNSLSLSQLVSLNQSTLARVTGDELALGAVRVKHAATVVQRRARRDLARTTEVVERVTSTRHKGSGRLTIPTLACHCSLLHTTGRKYG